MSRQVILSRVGACFEPEKEETLVLRRAAVQDGGPLGEAYGDYIFVFECLPDYPFGFYKYTYKILLEDLKPLKLLAGDFTGGGVSQLSVITYKTTEFDPVMAKRPFFYYYKKGRLYPLWLGSKLSRRFDTYVTWDSGNGATMIVAAEYQSGGMLLALYKWDNFGFIRIAQSGSYTAVTLPLQENPGGINAIADGEKVVLYYDGTEILKEDD